MNVFIVSLFQMSNKEREICKWVVFMQSRETQITMVKEQMLVDKQSEKMSDLLFTVHQHGGDDVT